MPTSSRPASAAAILTIAPISYFMILLDNSMIFMRTAYDSQGDRVTSSRH
jgi:hypothetical protein